MSAQIIPLNRAENGGTPARLRPPLEPTFRACVTGAAGRWWHRARLTVEVFGWLCTALSIIAAMKA